MRGTPIAGMAALLVVRIIPADAGSTQGDSCYDTDGEDHPRECGEHWNWIDRHVFGPGSSPRMRGAPSFGGAGIDCVGIIPADAGSTVDKPCSRSLMRDHPRGCGEHSPRLWHRLSAVGSSPRMRGALRGKEPAGKCARIIPADAGSTPSRGRNANPTQDHPRGCGEHRQK